MNLGDLAAIVSGIVPPSAECVYCHCSVKGLGLPIAEAGQVIRLLRDLIAPGTTIIAPSFPFATNQEYRDYVSREIAYDVSRTPARVNLFGELFRRKDGVRRSLDPVYPVAAWGPLAEELVRDNHLDRMPFGPRTGLGRIAARETCVLGLGVDVNTNSFMHFLDEPFLDRVPVPVYPRAPRHARVLRDGVLLAEGDYYYVTPELRQAIRPAGLMEALANQPFFRCFPGEWPCYALDLRPFLAFGVELARGAFAAGKLPVWYPQA